MEQPQNNNININQNVQQQQTYIQQQPNNQYIQQQQPNNQNVEKLNSLPSYSTDAFTELNKINEKPFTPLASVLCFLGLFFVFPWLFAFFMFYKSDNSADKLWASLSISGFLLYVILISFALIGLLPLICIPDL